MKAKQRIKTIHLLNYVALIMTFAICTTILTVQGMELSNQTIEQEQVITSDSSIDS